MKTIWRFLFSGILAALISSAGFAQDIIIKKDGDKVKAKIVEINDTQIKYYEFRDINNLLFTLDRALIKEIKFESGTKYKEERPGISEVYYAEDNIHNVKLNFLAIGGGDLILTFERAIDAGSSWEATFKLYGLGDGAGSQDQSGVGLNVGYKLKFGNLFKNSNEYRPKHILHGGYFRPILGFSSSTSKFDFGRNNTREEKDSYAHFGVDLGKQWILRNAVSIDLYLGFHYYGGSFTSDDPNADRFDIYNDVENGDIVGGDNRALTFGLRLGGLFSKKGIAKKK